MHDSTTVFLRPNPLAIRTNYVRELEKSGMVVLPQQNLAIYTCKAGARQGPQGIPGVDQNSWYSTIVCQLSDTVTPCSVGVYRETWRAPYPLDLTDGYVRMSLIDPPIGADFILDLAMNGVSMFSTALRIDDGSKTSVGSATPAVLSTLLVPDDAEFQATVLQIGSVEAGIGLKVAVTGKKTA